MFELAQLNLFTPEVRRGGGKPLAIHRHVLAGAGTGGGGVCGEDLYLDADVVGDHGDGGVRPVGGQPGGICRIGARHHLSPQAQGQSSRSPRNWGTPAAAPPLNPRDAFAKALGAISPALDRQGMVC